LQSETRDWRRFSKSTRPLKSLIGKDGILKDLTKRMIEKAMESVLMICTPHIGQNVLE